MFFPVSALGIQKKLHWEMVGENALKNREQLGEIVGRGKRFLSEKGKGMSGILQLFSLKERIFFHIGTF